MKCVTAWSSLYVQANGKVTPCCGDLYFGDASEGLDSVFNGGKATKLRQQMLSDSSELPSICTNCSLLARMGSDNAFPEMFPWVSRAEEVVDPVLMHSYKTLSESYDSGVLPPKGSKPLALMVQFGELCNIRCIMCPQDHANPVAITEEAVAKVKEAIPFISKIVFTGGEPTAFKQCWDIAEHFNINAPKNSYLGILTNLKTVTKQRVERYFSNINHLGLGINVDAATKETYEYIRQGANWEQLNKNLLDLIKYKKDNSKSNWHFNLTMTVMKSNIHEMVDLVKWCGELGIGFGCGPITGDYGPVKNARTYLEENIFRYPHLGISKDEMVSVFEQALAAAECIPEPYRNGAKLNISGMIDIARGTPSVEISNEDVERLRKIDDPELSLALQCIVLEGVAPWTKQKGNIEVPFWKRAGRKIIRIVQG